MMHGTTLGIDVAKNVFQLHGVDERGQITSAKAGEPWQVAGDSGAVTTVSHQDGNCGSAQYWARELQQLEHTVKLISPQFVKPYGAT